MSDVIYLTFDQVVALNERHCGEGAGVRDADGVRAQLGRAEASFGGYERYPGIFDKAAVILHGLSSTQYFHDGNKRTAWLATILFLGVNGIDVRDMSDVEAEAFVLSIATKAFENDDEPERGVEKATEWLAVKRLTMVDRYHYAFLAHQAQWQEDAGNALFNAAGAMLAGIATNEVFPAAGDISLVMHVRWLPVDANNTYGLRISAENPDVLDILMPDASLQEEIMFAVDPLTVPWDPSRILDTVEDTITVSASGDHPHHSGVFPTLAIYELPVVLKSSGVAHVRVEIDGELFARLPITIAGVSSFL